jgi:hypothetical protein
MGLHIVEMRSEWSKNVPFKSSVYCIDPLQTPAPLSLTFVKHFCMVGGCNRATLTSSVTHGAKHLCQR